jgi:hypothetical protein
MCARRQAQFGLTSIMLFLLLAMSLGSILFYSLNH